MFEAVALAAIQDPDSVLVTFTSDNPDPPFKPVDDCVRHGYSGHRYGPRRLTLDQLERLQALLLNPENYLIGERLKVVDMGILVMDFWRAGDIHSLEIRTSSFELGGVGRGRPCAAKRRLSLLFSQVFGESLFWAHKASGGPREESRDSRIMRLCALAERRTSN